MSRTGGWRSVFARGRFFSQSGARLRRAEAGFSTVLKVTSTMR